jgi:hypothetical protein
LRAGKVRCNKEADKVKSCKNMVQLGRYNYECCAALCSLKVKPQVIKSLRYQSQSIQRNPFLLFHRTSNSRHILFPILVFNRVILWDLYYLLVLLQRNTINRIVAEGPDLLIINSWYLLDDGTLVGHASTIKYERYFQIMVTPMVF